MALLIKNGEIVTASERFKADIWCENETITRIAPAIQPPPCAEVIDAAGKLVFPGFIDPHVHIHLPVMGTCAKDTHETASRAALIGGTTSFLEMIAPAPADQPAAAFELWRAKAQGRCACDFGFHLGVTRCDDLARTQFAELVQQGICSFKILLAYKGGGGLEDAQLFEALQLARQLGVLTSVHCENADLVAGLQRRLLAQGNTGPEWHYSSRPPLVEAEGVHHLLSFATLLDVPVYIVHLSCAEALREALAGRARGARVSIETLIQYLLLDKSFAERPNFEGAKYLMSPPLRDKANQDVLWDALRSGAIDTLASDHAPFDFATQKQAGRSNFTRIPSGLPGIEDRANLLYTHGVKAGRIDLHRFVNLASTRAAQLFGLYPRKGAIQPGSDADLVVYDTAFRGAISAKSHHMNVDYNPYEGMLLEGRPSAVTLRGKLMVSNGAFVGQQDRGRFLKSSTIS